MNTMTAMSNSSRTGGRYDREFKNNAVALVCSGRTVADVARDLGVSKWSLGRWVERAKAGEALSEPKTLSVQRPEQRELRRLRQELEYVSRQRDILKKPAAEEAEGTREAGRRASLVSGGAAERFTLMEKLTPQYPTDALAEALEVSASGFAAHRRKAERPRRQHDAQLRPLIRQSFEQSRRTYGSPPRRRKGIAEAGGRASRVQLGFCVRRASAAARTAEEAEGNSGGWRTGEPSPGSCGRAACGPGRSADSGPSPLTVGTATKSLTTGWPKCRHRIVRAKSGRATSPASKLRKAGSTSMPAHGVASLTTAAKTCSLP
jgi:transposase